MNAIVKCAECGRRDKDRYSKVFPGWCWWCINNNMMNRPYNAKGKPWTQATKALTWN